MVGGGVKMIVSGLVSLESLDKVGDGGGVGWDISKTLIGLLIGLRLGLVS